MNKRINELTLAVCLFFLASGSISAQTNLFEKIPGETAQFNLRFMRPSFSQDADLSALSGIYDLMVNVPIDDGWSGAASLPYIASSFGEGGSQNGIANIYLGVQHLLKMENRQTSVFSLGFYLPTAADDAQFMGIVTHVEKMYKYTPDELTFSGNYGYFKSFQSGIRLGLEVGPDISFPWESTAGDIELYLHYGAAAAYMGRHIMLNAEVQGIVIVTEEADELSDRFVHSVNFGTGYIGDSFTAGIFYKIYLKEQFSDIVDGVLGINLDYALK
jgi:hypothetical protein